MDYLNEVSKGLGVSRSTVCRAIRHSRSINYDTQRRVLEYIKQHFPEKLAEGNMNDRSKSSADKIITVVMPYKPKYFWDIAWNGISDAVNQTETGHIELKSYYYSGTRSEDELLSILSDIDTDATDALALVPVSSERTAEQIRRISSRIPVAVFNERCDGCGSYICVVSDGYKEGAELAKTLDRDVIGDAGLLVLSMACLDSRIMKDRISGFKDTMEAEGIKRHVRNLEIIMSSSSNRLLYQYNTLFPALLARQLAECIEISSEKGIPIREIYMPDGIMLPLYMALRKIKRLDIKVYGHEINKDAPDFFESGTMKGAYVCQDVYTQGYTAIKSLAAKLFSDEKLYDDDYITGFEKWVY